MTEALLELKPALNQHNRWIEPLLKHQAALGQVVATIGSQTVKQMQAGWEASMPNLPADLRRMVDGSALLGVGQAVKQIQAGWEASMPNLPADLRRMVDGSALLGVGQAVKQIQAGWEASMPNLSADLNQMVDAIADQIDSSWIDVLRSLEAWRWDLPDYASLQGRIGFRKGQELEERSLEILIVWVQDHDSECLSHEILWNDRMDREPDGKVRWSKLVSGLNIPPPGPNHLKQCDLLVRFQWYIGDVLIVGEVSSRIRKGQYYKVASQYRALTKAGHRVLPVLFGRDFDPVPSKAKLPNGLVAIPIPDSLFIQEARTMACPVELQDALERLQHGEPGLPPQIPVSRKRRTWMPDLVSQPAAVLIPT